MCVGAAVMVTGPPEIRSRLPNEARQARAELRGGETEALRTSGTEMDTERHRFDKYNEHKAFIRQERDEWIDMWTNRNEQGMGRDTDEEVCTCTTTEAR